MVLSPTLFPPSLLNITFACSIQARLMAKFHTLTVSDIRTETTDCVSVAFDVPDNLKADYKYIQGQYLTLRTILNGEDVRRSYSLCSSPVMESEWRIAAKEVPGGAMSPWINGQVSVGDRIDVMTPMGSFHTRLDASNSNSYVLFAGGSGITPVISIVKTILSVEPNSSMVLIYANRDQDSIIFRTQLDALNPGTSVGLK